MDKDDSWKPVGKVRKGNKSVIIELFLTCNLSAPAFVSMVTLDKVMMGEWEDGTIYQRKQA